MNAGRGPDPPMETITRARRGPEGRELIELARKGATATGNPGREVTIRAGAIPEPVLTLRREEDGTVTVLPHPPGGGVSVQDWRLLPKPETCLDRVSRGMRNGPWNVRELGMTLLNRTAGEWVDRQTGGIASRRQRRNALMAAGKFRECQGILP